MMNGNEKKSKKARLIETQRSMLGTKVRNKKLFDSSSDEAGDKEADQLTTAMDNSVHFGLFPSSYEPQDLSEAIPIDSSFTTNTSNPPQQELLIRWGTCYGTSY
ncbi:hypothetical protein CHS0354_017818 [Potamilus streckersoni]|uniref:Uncharacterized protein n=1 Tax=Potamilus streckersoni TaxID=2493646 RepID=A0AAE0T9I5_9BIVA|nr:hypothetical protein CHS0354_017818 [Potamilus streckersoni]